MMRDRKHRRCLGKWGRVAGMPEKKKAKNWLEAHPNY
jgi:hypothetical protein